MASPRAASSRQAAAEVAVGHSPHRRQDVGDRAVQQSVQEVEADEKSSGGDGEDQGQDGQALPPEPGTQDLLVELQQGCPENDGLLLVADQALHVGLRPGPRHHIRGVGLQVRLHLPGAEENVAGAVDDDARGDSVHLDHGPGHVLEPLDVADGHGQGNGPRQLRCHQLTYEVELALRLRLVPAGKDEVDDGPGADHGQAQNHGQPAGNAGRTP